MYLARPTEELEIYSILVSLPSRQPDDSLSYSQSAFGPNGKVDEGKFPQNREQKHTRYATNLILLMEILNVLREKLCAI